MTDDASKKPAAKKAAPAPKRVAKAAPAPAPAKGKAAPTAPAKAKKPEPERVPRAPTAFNLYQKQATKEFNAAHPELKTIGDRAKGLRAQWEALSDDARKPFEDEAAQLKAVADKKRAELKATKKANARPPGSYLLFCQEKRADIVAQNPGSAPTTITKLLGQAWKSLAEDEKAKYQAKAKELKDKYDALHPKSA